MENQNTNSSHQTPIVPTPPKKEIFGNREFLNTILIIAGLVVPTYLKNVSTPCNFGFIGCGVYFFMSLCLVLPIGLINLIIGILNLKKSIIWGLAIMASGAYAIILFIQAGKM